MINIGNVTSPSADSLIAVYAAVGAFAFVACIGVLFVLWLRRKQKLRRNQMSQVSLRTAPTYDVVPVPNASNTEHNMPDRTHYEPIPGLDNNYDVGAFQTLDNNK